MLTREGEVLFVEGAVVFDTVPALVEAAQEHLRQGVTTIDFTRVTEVDSSAVALALEWLRQAASCNAALRLRNPPSSMNNLAQLYGVSDLLFSAAAE